MERNLLVSSGFLMESLLTAVGVSAQEVQEVLPEAVKSVHY